MTMRRFRRQRRGPAPTTDRRSPEARLEALALEKNYDRRWRMIDRIRADAEAKGTAIEWMAAASTLRDRLLLGEDETYHLAELFAESATMAPAQDPELSRIDAELEAIERAHGLRPGESFYLDDAPEEWLAVNATWEARADALMAEAMRAGGLADVAATFVERRAKFEERANEGRRRLWGLDDEPLDELP